MKIFTSQIPRLLNHVETNVCILYQHNHLPQLDPNHIFGKIPCRYKRACQISRCFKRGLENNSFNFFYYRKNFHTLNHIQSACLGINSLAVFHCRQLLRRRYKRRTQHCLTTPESKAVFHRFSVLSKSSRSFTGIF